MKKTEKDGADNLILESSLVAAGNLTIKNGVHFSMECGREYTFNNITIESGGTLSFDGTEKLWTVLRCLGTLKVRGAIISRGFPAKNQPDETISRTTNDGTVLTHTYINNKFGGAGGMGGGWSRSHQAGGRGAKGTTYFGGGGGGGAGNKGDGTATAPGGNASGQSGGAGGQVPGNHDGGRGGNGGSKGTIDGGLIFLDCQGDFDGAGGVVDVEGISGGDGQRGFFVDCGAGGGGGGAPGGNGGKLVIRVGGNILPPTVKKEGGEGGKKGPGTPGSTAWSPPVPTSRAGDDGERGNSGKVEFI